MSTALGRAPLTCAYLAILVATSILVHQLAPSTVHQLLLASSTNLHELGRVPVRVLVVSAFWISDGHVLPWLLLLGVVGGLAEARRGTLGAATVFVAGHIGASLIVAAGLAFGVTVGAVSPSVANMVDVGPSYGFAALAAFVATSCTARWRTLALLALGAWLVTAWIGGIDVTGVGHLTAAAIGFVCVAFSRRRDRTRRISHPVPA
jgi:hypothetical protein